MNIAPPTVPVPQGQEHVVDEHLPEQEHPIGAGLDPHEAAAVLAQDPSLLRLVVQPIVNTRTAEVAGYEVLSRCPAEWGVNPADLFAAAESSGLGPALAVAVLDRAVELRDQLPPGCFLSVNCSPNDLASEQVRAWIATADLARTFLEMTETSWPEDEGAVLETVRVARSRGARIAADDVGAGYAGLLQLVRLRPDLIKVDRSLASRVNYDPAGLVVIEVLGQLAGYLDAWLLVEGVENRDQLTRLLRLDVPLVQGFYLGEPTTAWSDGAHADLLRARLDRTEPGAVG